MAMATATHELRSQGLELGSRWAGPVAGVLAAWFMGLHMWAMNQAVIAKAIPALYGLEGAAAGWIVHLAHGAALGALFALAVESDLVPVRTPARCAGLAVAWGVALWVGMAALLMPVWLSAVGFANAPPFPNFAPPSLFWHVLYGIGLGAVYTVVR